MTLAEWAVEAIHLVKQYKDLQAVKGIHFRIRPQECFGFLGPNGAGKTTTVRMIYGFATITSGSLQVMGLDLTRRPREVKSRLGVVPQEDNLDPELTVMENLQVYASYFSIPRETANARSRDLLKLMDLEGKGATPVEQLSGGMKRRLTIARALINKPDVLLLDEPTTGLDPQAKRLVWQRLRQLKADGVTIILTTHNMEEAQFLCDRLVVMDQGEILAEGTPGELIDSHVGGEVLELGGALGVKDELMDRLAGMYHHFLQVGDALFLFTGDGKNLARQVNQSAWHFSHQLLRPATLEDVFLKLTGRELTEDAG